MTISWIAFHITDRCQLNCDHCLRDPDQKAVDLPVDLFRRILAQGRATFGTDHAALTGGEPTLHPEFEALIDALVDEGYTWHMISNAERFDRVIESLQKRPERLAALTRVSISLDGADRETHDSIRGPGSWDTVMRAVTLCTAIELPFYLQIAINARNVHQIDAFGLLAAQLGASKVSYGLTFPTGTFLDRNLYLSPDEWRRVARQLARLQDVLAVPIDWSAGFPSDKAFHSCAPWSGDPLHVDVQGRLNLCCNHSGVPTAGDGPPTDVAADLRDTDLVDAWSRMLDIVAETQRWRVRDIAAGKTEGWDAFPCNWCMKAHGKPHWAGDGAEGPSAGRERWRGAWTPGYKASHHDAGVGAPKDDSA